jgi:hypothetical protein
MGERDPNVIARHILDAANIRASDVVSPVIIAGRLGMNVHKVPARLLRGADGMLCWASPSWRICVRNTLPPERLRFVVAHEIAERYFKTAGCEATASDKEQQCDAVAACLVTPTEVFVDAVNHYGHTSFRHLASAFLVTQTCAALRVGEVTPTPLAVLHPTAVRFRGVAQRMPSDLARLRRLARGKMPPGLEKIRLTDEPKRVVLLETA